MLCKVRPTSLSIRYLEVGLLGSMLATLMIPSAFLPIAVWSEISLGLFARAIIWLLGLTILPGVYIMRLTGITKDLSIIEKVAIEINVSLAVIGLSTLILYFVQIDVLLFPWAILSLLIILGPMHWFKRRHNSPTFKLEYTKWHFLLIIGTVAIIIIAFLVQLNQQYLIPGDNWVALKPAVEIVSQRNVYESFSGIYPIMFGFILAGLSVSSGLPVVNTQVLLFPLAAVNILIFFTLVKTVFNMNDKISVISSILYGFGGGLGYLIQTIAFHGQTDFWTVSFLSQDMYFSPFFWHSIQFSYKSLALTLAFTSIVLFMISIKQEEKVRKAIAVTSSSFLMLNAFLIHMIELLVLVPMIIIIAYVYEKGRSRFLYPIVFLLTAALLAYVMDLAMFGYYFSITISKLKLLQTTISIEKLLVYLTLLLSTILTIFIVRRFLSKHVESLFTNRARFYGIAKSIFTFTVLITYFGGLVFFVSAPSSEILSTFSGNSYLTLTFPWNLYVTRYGFVGGLAILGIAVTRWKEKWFMIASSWSILTILLGSLWWGERINSYLFPMLAIFASMALEWSWTQTKKSTILDTTGTNPSKSFRSRLKSFRAIVLITVLTLSFTSVIYGAGYYTFGGPPTSDDEAKVFAWVQRNTPSNATILVPKKYTISKGIFTIGDRQIYEDIRLPQSIDSSSFANLTQTLFVNNIKYAVSLDNSEEKPDLLKCLLAYSTPVFESGKIKVFELPTIKPPSKEGITTTVYKETLGLITGNKDFGWVDDEFTNNWLFRNINASSNGEIITLHWSFQAGDSSEPSMVNSFPPIITNDYPYIIVRYRNTDETSATAENNLGQIITLINESGYPQGFIKNYYLPVSRGAVFNTFVSQLPENQSIASVSIWMRNYKEMNGTVSLQIDYIGFASSESVAHLETKIRFLSMAIPSLWSADYFISTNFSEAENASIIVSTYNKGVSDYVNNMSNCNAFLFLNASADFPNWGTQWRIIIPGVILGYLNDKKVIIAGVNTLQGGISNLAETIYTEIANSQTRYLFP